VTGEVSLFVLLLFLPGCDREGKAAALEPFCDFSLFAPPLENNAASPPRKKDEDAPRRQIL
jgi:hypothetical protein